MRAFFTCIIGLLTTVAFTQSVIYTDAASLITGTWTGNGTLTEVSTDNPYEGSNHYQFTYNFTEYWSGFGLNMDNWGSGPRRDLSGFTHLQIAYRGLDSGTRLTIQLRQGNDTYGNTVEVGQAAASYQLIDIPMVALTSGTLWTSPKYRKLTFLPAPTIPTEQAPYTSIRFY